MCFGGGGSSTPTTTTVNNVAVPEYLQGPEQQLVGQAQALTSQPFQSYIGNASAGGQGLQGTNVAGFSPMQNQAFKDTQNLNISPQISQGTGLTGLAAQNANNIAGSYKPFNSTNQYNGPDLKSQNFGYNSVNAPNLNQYQMQGPQTYTGANVQQYMSPYTSTLQNQAISNYANSLPQLGSAATQVGGLGGDREALMQSQAQQGLQQNLANIQAQAFGNAQNQFNTSQQMQQYANTQNLQAQLGVQQLGAGQNLASQQLNQQAGLTSQGQQLSQEQMLNQLGVQSAGLNAQYGLGSQQLNSQQQQYLAGLGLNANQQMLNAGAQMGNLGQEQYNQQTGIINALSNAGSQQQQLSDDVNNALNANFNNAQNFPYAQGSYLSSLLRGSSPGALGAQTSSSTYAQSPNIAAQLGGIGSGLAGIFGASRAGG
jgi:hypothetical protein